MFLNRQGNGANMLGTTDIYATSYHVVTDNGVTDVTNALLNGGTGSGGTGSVGPQGPVGQTGATGPAGPQGPCLLYTSDAADE